MNETDTDLYGRMSAALNATGRPIAFSLCQWGEASVWEWGAQVCAGISARGPVEISPRDLG